MSRTPRPGAHFDVLVVGSGFGGSVAALRLTEKGYRVGVAEAGARLDDADLPSTSFEVSKYLFAPRLGCYGILRIDTLRDAMILSGAGVGGGSLGYANTLYRPPQAFYDDPQWRHITDWRAELAPYYDQAERMLGVVPNPTLTPSDRVMRQVAEDLGVGDTFTTTPVGVYFGPDGASPDRDRPDPFFGGAGPSRRPCRECGECMTGCRHNAKNTLVKNYLYLAEQAGARVMPLTTVDAIRPREGGGYDVTVRYTRARRATSGTTRVLSADQVIVAAAALGTQRLLHAQRDAGNLPRLSARLGHLARTNSESILGAIGPVGRTDYSRGVAITSSFHPEPDTHVEPVRYGRGSNAMALLQSVLTDGDGAGPSPRSWLAELWRQRRGLRSLYDLRHWSERTVIALVMQSLDNSIVTFTRRSRLTGRRILTSRQGHGRPNPTWIPMAHRVVRRMAEVMGEGSTAGGNIGEPFQRPLTAHFIGGCAIGDSAGTGVVDPWHRVYGHPGLHITDGSTISANLGVNPSLTITAQAERAMAFWPNKGEQDPRPPLGERYAPVEPVTPASPVVPQAAPGALRLPIVERD